MDPEPILEKQSVFTQPNPSWTGDKKYPILLEGQEPPIKFALICHPYVTTNQQSLEQRQDFRILRRTLLFSLFPWSHSITAGPYGHTVWDAVTSSHSPRTPICYHNLQYSLGMFYSSLQRHIVKDAMLDPTASLFVWWEFSIWISNILDKEMHRNLSPKP